MCTPDKRVWLRARGFEKIWRRVYQLRRYDEQIVTFRRLQKTVESSNRTAGYLVARTEKLGSENEQLRQEVSEYRQRAESEAPMQNRRVSFSKRIPVKVVR